MDNASTTAEQPQPTHGEIRPPGTAVLVVSLLLTLMFMGMMHEFRSAGMTHEQLAETILDRMSRFEQNVNAANPEQKAAFILSALLAAYCFLSAKSRVKLVSPVLAILILATLAWTCASWFWSIDQAKTARELLRVTVYFGLSLGLAVRFNRMEVCWLIFLTSVWTVAFACAFEIAFGAVRELDGTWRLAGSLHPNPLGRFANLVAIPALVLWRSGQGKRWLWLALVLFAAAVIVLTKSRTALASCLVGVGMVYALTPGWRRLVLQASLVVLIAGGGLMFYGAYGPSSLRASEDVLTMGRNEKVSTLTGRLPLWGALLNRSESRRAQGFGFGAFWTVSHNESIHDEVGWIAGHAHSGYVEILIGLGVVGLSLMLAASVLATAHMVYGAVARDSAACRVLAAMMVAALVNSITEGGFAMPRELGIFSMVFAIVAALEIAKQEATYPAPTNAPAQLFVGRSGSGGIA